MALSVVKNNIVFQAVASIFDWYPSHYSPLEKKLLRKIDVSILVFACVSFFVKFLDQSNITNAYVSGMKEDLGLYGNQLNYLNMFYYGAYVIAQVPMLAFQTRPSIAAWYLPSLEVLWGVITFGQSQVKTAQQLYACRALLGWFEAPSFAGTHFILGSWYKKEELFKRAGLWFTCASLGSMFSGYLQAAAYKGLNHVQGLAGWRWLFIIDGVITIPLALIGFLFFPGLPSSKKPWFFTAEEHALATSRLGPHHKPAGKLTFDVVKRTVKRPLYWICVLMYVCLIQSSYWSGYMSLWLKSENTKTKTTWSVELINILPTFINLVTALSSWIGTSLAGKFGVVKFMAFGLGAATISEIILTVWFVPSGLKFLAFYLGGFLGMVSPVLFSWLNTVACEDPEGRALIMSSMMTAGYCTYVWVPLFTYPTIEAPRFVHGYPASLAFTVSLLIIFFYAVRTFKRPDQRVPLSTIEDVSSRAGSVSSGEDYDEKKQIDASKETTAGTVVATTELR